MEPFELSVLCAVALAASILSAIVGMAGGIVLLSVMLLFLEPLVAIPLHGVIQLVSNAARTAIQRRHVARGIVWRYGLLLFPMGFVGLAIAQALSPSHLRLWIGSFVLLATWAPGWVLLGTHPERTDPNRRFLALGGVAGVLNLTLGATGPLIAPFFLNLGLSRFALIGTKAICQCFGHLAKIGIFAAAGFAFAAYLPMLLVLWAMVVAGTWTGSQLLTHVNERAFTWLYKTVLTVIALRLVVEGLSVFGAL